MSDEKAGSKKGRVLGVGGIFFRADDPAKLGAWYSEYLGLNVETWGDTHGASFVPANLPEHAFTVWSAFSSETEYFGPSRQQFMINLIVDDLDAALANAQRGGAEIVDEREEHEFGRFGWFVDPGGNRVELWQVPDSMPEDDS